VFGGGSIQLARVFGIRIGADPSWFVVLFLIIWSLSGYYEDLFPGEGGKTFFLATLSALAFFLSILLHELGHALVAIRNGIPISGIDLWLFGGVAKLERDTDSPGVEFRVAIAGPLVTLAIAALCFGIATLTANADDAVRAMGFETGTFDEVTAVLGYLVFINVVVLVFNLIPGFPLDGGRIARALAWWRTGDRNRATRFAARLGRGAGWIMVGLGLVLLLSGNLIAGVWLAFIGVFLAQAARSAEVQAAFAGRIEGLRVADVMDAEPVAIPAALPLDRALDEFFLRYGWPWFPVVDDAGRLLGIVSREAVDGADAERSLAQVGSVMARLGPSSGMRAGIEDALESVLALDGLRRLGAIMAVDSNGVLRGIVTIDQVRRALA
jgi:Zn-dependent protease